MAAEPREILRLLHSGTDTPEYCRAIETYLCRKNDGHLIRVVGPSFELVSRWARDGIPLKVAFGGIDRYCERYYRKGPRRRPVRIDFCEADVLDVFDEWRRATGLTSVDLASARPDEAGARAARRGVSLPEHIERVVVRLTNARATGVLGDAADPIIDELARELDVARAQSSGLRGAAREAMVARLAVADAALLAHAFAAMDAAARASAEREAADEVAAFRDRLSPEAFERAHKAAVDHLIRARLGLPTIAFS